jgi:hypothetical protein
MTPCYCCHSDGRETWVKVSQKECPICGSENTYYKPDRPKSAAELRYIGQQNKTEALRYFKDQQFTKEQLELMITQTLLEGGITLQEVKDLADEWKKIVRMSQ